MGSGFPVTSVQSDALCVLTLDGSTVPHATISLSTGITFGTAVFCDDAAKSLSFCDDAVKSLSFCDDAVKSLSVVNENIFS